MKTKPYPHLETYTVKQTQYKKHLTKRQRKIKIGKIKSPIQKRDEIKTSEQENLKIIKWDKLNKNKKLEGG